MKIEEQRFVEGHGELTAKNGSIPSRNKKKKKQFEVFVTDRQTDRVNC